MESPADPNLLASYVYELPEKLIAQSPAEPRDSSRLLVLDRARGTWEHRKFTDLPEYLDSSDLVVANNTRVLKARLLGQRIPVPGELGGGEKGGKVEFLLLEELSPLLWEGLFRASARALPGLRFEIPTPDGRGLRARLVRGAAESPTGSVVAEFERDPLESGAGEIPLPHYIRRRAESAPGPGSESDEKSYQTVYASASGSAAAPTAGLHFTPRVLEGLRASGATWTEVTLHVGVGTFRPVKEPRIQDHPMHEERYEISGETAALVSAAKTGVGKRVLAVGTTTVRTLESAWDAEHGLLGAGPGRTRLFIHPGRDGASFRVVDRLLTNFHLPGSTLLMMVCAFAGRERVLAAYGEAIREGYRFFSYGDSMLIV